MAGGGPLRTGQQGDAECRADGRHGTRVRTERPVRFGHVRVMTGLRVASPGATVCWKVRVIHSREGEERVWPAASPCLEHGIWFFGEPSSTVL